MSLGEAGGAVGLKKGIVTLERIHRAEEGGQSLRSRVSRKYRKV